MRRKVIEMGNYISVAYAGMILAEQDYSVEKWTTGKDPILELNKGDELWHWINHKKTICDRHASDIKNIKNAIVIDNFLPDTFVKWGISPSQLAQENNLRWISLHNETKGRSFDLIAQARVTADFCGKIPFFIGDTVAGLFIAFKTVADQQSGHYILGHSSCLQKIIEGEMIVEIDRKKESFDPLLYDLINSEALIEYKNEIIKEPIRDKQWRLDHLFHQDGRIII